MTRPAGRPALAAFGGAVALLVAGCGGGPSSSTPAADGTESQTVASSATSASEPSASATTVEGVRLTAQGSRLSLGDTARVTWKPDQKTTGVIAVRVTRLQKLSISAFSDWRLSRTVQQSTPYFVHAVIRNLGHADLSHVPVPLYLLDDRNTLLQSSRFEAQYAPCPSHPLPAKFTTGTRTSVCLVYFVPGHGRLVAISFRPTQSFQAITWRGPLTKPSKKGPTKH